MKLTSMNHELNTPLFTGLCHFPYLDNRLPVFFFAKPNKKNEPCPGCADKAGA